MSFLGEPFLSGYTTTYDPDTGEWVARSNTRRYELRGKDQAELDQARWDLIVRLAEDLSEIINAAPMFGYSSPPGRGTAAPP